MGSEEKQLSHRPRTRRSPLFQDRSRVPDRHQIYRRVLAKLPEAPAAERARPNLCLLYTSDAADDTP